MKSTRTKTEPTFPVLFLVRLVQGDNIRRSTAGYIVADALKVLPIRALFLEAVLPVQVIPIRKVRPEERDDS